MLMQYNYDIVPSEYRVVLLSVKPVYMNENLYILKFLWLKALSVFRIELSSQWVVARDWSKQPRCVENLDECWQEGRAPLEVCVFSFTKRNDTVLFSHVTWLWINVSPALANYHKGLGAIPFLPWTHIFRYLVSRWVILLWEFLVQGLTLAQAGLELTV